MHRATFICATMCGASFPDNFIPKICSTKNCIHHNSQIMTCRRIAMEIDASGGFEDSVKLEQAVRHHDEVCHHIVLAQERAESADHFRHIGIGLMEQVFEFGFGLLAPMP